jgi:hypothetical protein
LNAVMAIVAFHGVIVHKAVGFCGHAARVRTAELHLARRKTAHWAQMVG